jgi:hypothetical protein
MTEYRQIEYALMQGIGGHFVEMVRVRCWRSYHGPSADRGGPIAATETAINRALAVKKVRLVPPQRSD